MSSRRYNPPSGKVGRRFVRDLNVDRRGVRDIWWNSEQFIVLQTVILQQSLQVTSYHTIGRRIEKRLDAWDSGIHGMLAEDMLRTCAQYLTDNAPMYRPPYIRRLSRAEDKGQAKRDHTPTKK